MLAGLNNRFDSPEHLLLVLHVGSKWCGTLDSRLIKPVQDCKCSTLKGNLGPFTFLWAFWGSLISAVHSGNTGQGLFCVRRGSQVETCATPLGAHSWRATGPQTSNDAAYQARLLWACMGSTEQGLTFPLFQQIFQPQTCEASWTNDGAIPSASKSGVGPPHCFLIRTSMSCSRQSWLTHANYFVFWTQGGSQSGGGTSSDGWVVLMVSALFWVGRQGKKIVIRDKCGPGKAFWR